MKASHHAAGKLRDPLAGIQHLLFVALGDGSVAAGAAVAHGFRKDFAAGVECIYKSIHLGFWIAPGQGLHHPAEWTGHVESALIGFEITLLDSAESFRLCRR